MKDRRTDFQIKIAAAKRLVMWHFLNKQLDLVLLSEFPKSGGSWLATMLSEITGIPFPRNVTPKFERSIMHGHHLYNRRFGKMVAILRDGRDVMISAYYHFLFENDRNPKHSIRLHRSQLDFENYDDIQTNLPDFIEYMFTKFADGRFHLSWTEFVNDYVDNKQVVLTKYEDLLDKPVVELSRILDFLGYHAEEIIIQEVIYKNSFKNLSNRNPGQTDNRSFLRKGIAGDWKNHFTLEAKLVFNKFAGEALIKAGYVENEDWS